MKLLRFFFGCILLIIVQGHPQTFTINHDFNYVNIHSDGKYHTVEYTDKIDLSGLDNPQGQPQLPVYLYRISLKSGETIQSFKIEDFRERKLEGNYRIRILQPLWRQDLGEINAIAANTTLKNYPEDVIEFKGIKYFNGHPIAHFAVHPFRYKSGTGSLYFIEQIRFSINKTTDGSAGVIPLPEFQPETDKLLSLAQEIPLKPELALPVAVTDGSIEEEDGVPLSYISAGLVDRYIIITTSGLASSFEPLAEWKTRKGVPTIIKTLDWVRSNFPDGVDDAERIRNYIRWSYKNRGTKYIMLGGDTELIPARILTTGGFTFPADYYYADLDGNWNADQDDIFGEAVDKLDGYPETYVSRIPVQTPQEVERFIVRLLKYEKLTDIENPYFPGDVLYLAANLDRDNDGRDLIMNKIDPEINSEFRRTLLTENADIGSDPAPALNALNDNPALIFTENHGLYHTLRPGAKGSNIYTYQIGKLTNHDPGIWYVASCYTNDIIKRSLSEMYLLAENGGGVAYIGNSSYEYPFSGVYLQKEFFRLVFSEDKYHLAEAHYLSRLIYLGYLSWEGPSRIIVYSTLVLGDAEMPIWTAMPKSIIVNRQQIPSETGNFLIITVKNKSDSSAIENALVTLYRKNDLYELKKTNATGQAQFNIIDYEPGEVNLTITKHNFIPYEDTVRITPQSLPHPKISQIAFEEINGLDNGQCEPGERLNMNLEIENSGDLGIPAGMIVQWIGSDSLIHLDTIALALDDSLAPGQKLNLPALAFDVSGTIKTDTTLIKRIQFILGVKSLGERDVLFPVHVPNVVPSDPEIESSLSGPEILSTVNIELDNSGIGGARAISGRLCTVQPGVQLIDSVFDYGNISPGEVTNYGAFFTLKHLIPVDSLIFEFSLSDYYGNKRLYKIDFNNPVPPSALSFKPHDAESIELNWSASPSSDVRGYNIFRKDTPESDFHKVTDKLIERAGFFVDGNLNNDQTYRYTVQAVDSSYNVSKFAPDTVTAWPAVEPKLNFPLDAGEKSIGSDYSGIAVYDFDGDGKQEIAASGGHGVLKIYNCDGVLQYDISNLKGFMHKPAVGNVYGSPAMEIVVSASEKKSENNSVYIIDPQTGQLIESLPLGYHQPSAVVLKDIDKDGYDDIIVLTLGNEVPAPSRLIIWRSTGKNWTAFPGWTSEGFSFEGSASLGMPASADMTGDGIISIVVPTYEGKVYAFQPLQSAEPVWTKSLSGMLNAPISIADIDRDGNLDMAAVSIDMDKLYILDHLGNGLPGWESGKPIDATNPWYVGSPAIMANLDVSDEQLEIVYVGRDSVHLFKSTGENLNHWPVAIENGDNFFDPRYEKLSVNSCPVIGDLDQDGVYEIIFVTRDGLIHALNSLTAKEIKGFPVNSMFDEIRYQSPLVTDVDNDGDLDLLFFDHGGKLHFWDMGTKYNHKSLLFWSQPYSNFRHTGQIDTLIMYTPDALDENFDVHPPQQFYLKQNYPNPFNPVTIIEFGLQQTARVDLTIFNLLGQKVVSLVSGVQSTGMHHISWNGKNANNMTLASGIYIYQINVKDTNSGKILFKKQEKMILLK